LPLKFEGLTESNGLLAGESDGNLREPERLKFETDLIGVTRRGHVPRSQANDQSVLAFAKRRTGSGLLVFLGGFRVCTPPAPAPPMFILLDQQRGRHCRLERHARPTRWTIHALSRPSCLLTGLQPATAVTPTNASIPSSTSSSSTAVLRRNRSFRHDRCAAYKEIPCAPETAEGRGTLAPLLARITSHRTVPGRSSPAATPPPRPGVASATYAHSPVTHHPHDSERNT